VEPSRQAGKAASTSLASCHGYRVVASDGPCGAVETPLFPPGCGDPDFLVLRLGGRVVPRFPILPAGLVVRVDVGAETIVVAAGRDDIRHLPEQLPLAR
jgi:hypothetical protein